MRESLCYTCIHLVKDKSLDGFCVCDVKAKKNNPCNFYSVKTSFYDKYCWKCKHINHEESRQCLMGFYRSDYESFQKDLDNMVKEYNKGNMDITCPYFKPYVIVMKNKDGLKLEGYNGN